MKYISTRTLRSSTPRERASETCRPLTSRDLAAVRGAGFGGGLSRENFGIASSEDISSGDDIVWTTTQLVQRLGSSRIRVNPPLDHLAVNEVLPDTAVPGIEQHEAVVGPDRWWSPVMVAIDPCPLRLYIELDGWRAWLAAAGCRWQDAGEIPGTRRGHTWDPFGNHIELIEAK